MRLLVATSNPGKLDELRALLPNDVELVSLTEADVTMPEETGATFIENALIKARAAASYTDAALADDSGLEVEALGGRPGVRSARYAGPEATDADNNRKLLDELARLSSTRPAARFVSAVAVVTRDGREFVATGTVDGVIVEQPRGSGGFGYDPLFEIQDSDAGPLNGRTLAELSVSEKNLISHRARAYRAVVSLLEESRFLSRRASKVRSDERL